MRLTQYSYLFTLPLILSTLDVISTEFVFLNVKNGWTRENGFLAVQFLHVLSRYSLQDLSPLAVFPFEFVIMTTILAIPWAGLRRTNNEYLVSMFTGLYLGFSFAMIGFVGYYVILGNFMSGLHP